MIINNSNFRTEDKLFIVPTVSVKDQIIEIGSSGYNRQSAGMKIHITRSQLSK